MPTEELQLVTAEESAHVESLERADTPAIWKGFETQLESLTATAKTLVVTDVNQKAEIKLARTTRLALKDLRCEIERKRKELGEVYLRKTQKINADAKKLKELIEPLEARLKDQEEFAERAKSEQAFALVDEYESELHAKDKENTQLQATVARLEAHVKDLEQRQEVIRAYVPQTAGDVVMAKWPLPPFEGHEWDNRTSEENAVWCLGEFRDIIARLEGELAALQKEKARNFTCVIRTESYLVEEAEQKLAAEKAAHENTKQKCALYRQHSEAQDKLLSQFQDGGAEAMENAREDEIEKLRADLEAAKRERDEQTARADDLLDTLDKTVEKIGYTEEVAKEAEAATGSKLVSDGIKWWFDQKSTDRDALAFQVERLREALEKVASLINESTGVAGLHLNGEVAPWCDLMTGGKYEGWLCGVFESLELDAPTALRERLEAETKPLVEALEEVRLDLQTTIYLYERNGPQWTSRETGHEYYDASYVIESARDKIEKIDTALAEKEAND